MKDKIVIYFSGGAMRGVFGAGVATYLEEANIYDKIEAIYSSSSGALTAAYFLSKQTHLGSSIFYEDLTSNFISITNFWIGIWQRIQNKFLYKLSVVNMRDAMDINYLFNVMEKKKVLNTQEIINQPIPIYVKVFNLRDRQVEYLEARNENILSILKASVSSLPYVHKSVIINDINYTDAGTIEQIGIQYLIDKYPKKKIVVVFSQSTRRNFKIILKNYLEGIFTSFMHGNDFFSRFASSTKKVINELEIIKNNPNILLVKMPIDKEIPTRETNSKKLIRTYNHGISEAKKIIDFIENDA